MAGLVRKQLSPEELIEEIENRAYRDIAFVIMSIGDWKTITHAYHSPLVDKIADDIIQINPHRPEETGELSFEVFAREFSHE